MTRPKPKGKVQGAPLPLPECGHWAAENHLYGQIRALMAEAARQRLLSAAEVVGVLTAVIHDVFEGLWMMQAREREQRRKAQAGEEKA